MYLFLGYGYRDSVKKVYLHVCFLFVTLFHPLSILYFKHPFLNCLLVSSIVHLRVLLKLLIKI